MRSEQLPDHCQLIHHSVHNSMVFGKKFGKIGGRTGLFILLLAVLSLTYGIHPFRPARRQAADDICCCTAGQPYKYGVDEGVAVEVPDHHREEGGKQAGNEAGLIASLPEDAQEQWHQDAAGDDTHADRHQGHDLLWHIDCRDGGDDQYCHPNHAGE